VGRAIGQAGFENFWNRFDRLDRPTRKAAGKAMLKMLPDAVQRLTRRLLSGPIEQRLKAMQITHELSLGELMKPALMQMAQDPNAKLRSKAVAILGELGEVPSDVLLERVLNDSDARVRANAIEVLETKNKAGYVPLLAERARASTNNNRERANAIKALHRMKVRQATQALQAMLQDPRPEHRISAIWALRQIGWWQLLSEVGRLAREDQNLRVRRYALAVLRTVAEMVKLNKAAG
jgi:HEAT repeat protein